MILWTFQDVGAYEVLVRDGVLRADAKYISEVDGFLAAYDWLSDQMRLRIGDPPDGVKYPVWAWYRIRCEHKKPDLRFMEFRFSEPQVLLEIEIPDDEVLLSDEENWHFVLNNWYYPEADNMLEWDEKDNWFDRLPEGAEKEAIRRKSWEAIFDIEIKNGEMGTQGRYVQATFWELHLDQVKSVRVVKTK